MTRSKQKVGFAPDKVTWSHPLKLVDGAYQCALSAGQTLTGAPQPVAKDAAKSVAK